MGIVSVSPTATVEVEALYQALSQSLPAGNDDAVVFVNVTCRPSTTT